MAEEDSCSSGFADRSRKLDLAKQALGGQSYPLFPKAKCKRSFYFHASIFGFKTGAFENRPQQHCFHTVQFDPFMEGFWVLTR